MNFLVGRNNHGKSTLLRAASQWAAEPGARRAAGSQRTLVPFDSGGLLQLLHRCGVRDAAEQKRRLDRFTPLSDHVVGMWSERRQVNNPEGARLQELKRALGIESYSVSHPESPLPHMAARAVLIPAFRQLRATEDGASPDLASGEGLVAELGAWERPRHPGTEAYKLSKQRWAKLNVFVRDVLEDPEAELEVAGARDLHVRLAQAGAMLHIDSLGDGIKQILMIAAACIYFDDHLVLLEEPEIHLHAGVQRKLMRFLEANTSSQYLIATHSAHVLDLPGSKIFHVTHDGKSSKVAPAVRTSDVQQVCLELGYMASDLLQANYTIWVEGPSDRVYWARWLQLVDPELIEGVHFSIMSYGGYLIDGVHLRDEPDPATEDLVQLLKLGRQCVVIADSDLESAEGALRPTLQRLRAESEVPGNGDVIVCDWVRTVENLVPRELFRRVVLERHQRAGRLLKTATSFTAFDPPFLGMRRGSYSKVTIAKDVAAQLTREHMSERLFTTVKQLAETIRSANGLPASSVQ